MNVKKKKFSLKIEDAIHVFPLYTHYDELKITELQKNTFFC